MTGVISDSPGSTAVGSDPTSFSPRIFPSSAPCVDLDFMYVSKELLKMAHTGKLEEFDCTTSHIGHLLC